MEYLILTKADYDETYSLWRAGDRSAAKRVILDQTKEGKETILALEIPFELELKVSEPGAEVKAPARSRTKKVEETTEEEVSLEAGKDQTEPGKDTGD